MKKFLTATAIISAFAAFSTPANAVEGKTNFKVTVPKILVLYHWDEAQLNLDSVVFGSNGMGNANGNGNFGNTSYTVGGNDITDANATAPTTGLNSNISVTLDNAWAVRSIASSDVTLTVSKQDDLYLGGDNTSSNKIAIDDNTVKLSVNTANDVTSGDGTNTLALKPGWRAKVGDIKFTMNLSEVTSDGTYSSPTGSETFLLTLTGN